ncbi:DUF222 domain-containing protein [Rhodococcus sp. 077-4]|uniref:HNH endonuclease signature motif containing protein n=1 Tax=Rhodococcus sp. 077-4 TaxID=2789271 RepID=UPI0039F51751
MKASGDVSGFADQELVSALADVSSHESALAAAKYAVLAEMDRRGLAMKLGYSTVTRWYARSVRITDGSATRQVALGYWLTDRPSVLDSLATGEIHAAHATAIADGYDTVVVADPTLDEDHRDAVVAELLDTARRSTAGQVASRAQALAHSAADDARARHEKAEKERRDREQASRADAGSGGADSDDGAADSGDSGGAGGTGGSEADGSDSTGSAENAGDPESAGREPVPPGPPPVPVSENPGLNRFDVHRLANGRFQLGGSVDRLLAEKMLTALSRLTAPQPGPGGERDPRSPSKRRADALDQILDRHLRGSTRGTAGGARASVHLIVPLRDLLAHGAGSAGSAAADSATHRDGTDRVTRTGAGHSSPTSGAGAAGDSDRESDTGAGDSDRNRALDSDAGRRNADWPFHFDWTGPMSRNLAELLTCDADLTPVIVDHHGVPLALGRTTRLATDDQRIALTIRDTCCVMCGRPAQWCQAHHMKFWEHGGTTDLNNLALVCGECHRLVHHGDWQLIMGTDGHPYAIPPESVDPRRQPIPSYHRRKQRAA